MDTLDQFVEELIQEKGFENVEPEVLEQIKADLKSRLEDRINALILEKIPPDKMEEFEKLIDSQNVETIQSFAQAHIPDFDQHIANELLAFRTTYL